MTGLPPGHLTLRLRGSCGQSLGAFAVQGLKIEVFGDANDYVGKGLSGATIALRPMLSAHFVARDNTIIGNTVLYGATAGKLFAAGQAGERFAVRNSGATAVIEGCGSNGCEYMTGGTVAILGAIGDNFAAGMTGGMAFVYDADGMFERHINADTVIWQRVDDGALARRAARADRRTSPRNRLGVRHRIARALGPRNRQFLAGRAEGNGFAAWRIRFRMTRKPREPDGLGADIRHRPVLILAGAAVGWSWRAFARSNTQSPLTVPSARTSRACASR